MMARTNHVPVTMLAIVFMLGLTGTLMAQERILISSEWGDGDGRIGRQRRGQIAPPHVADYDPNA